MNILVLCTGNSARSILLESLFNQLGKGRVAAYSAGSKPQAKSTPNHLSCWPKKATLSKACAQKAGMSSPMARRWMR